MTALAVAKNVKLGRITSSPGPTPSAIRASSKASLPDAAADGVSCLAVGGQLLFQFGDLRAQHESAALADAGPMRPTSAPAIRRAGGPGPTVERPASPSC